MGKGAVKDVHKAYRDSFMDIYGSFREYYLSHVFQSERGSLMELTTVEAICMEVIQRLDKPTINQFANFVRISQPNAAYKVNTLIRKGYLAKEQSEVDKREYHLYPTRKYLAIYNNQCGFLERVLDRHISTLSEEELAAGLLVASSLADALEQEMSQPD